MGYMYSCGMLHKNDNLKGYLSDVGLGSNWIIHCVLTEDSASHPLLEDSIDLEPYYYPN